MRIVPRIAPAVAAATLTLTSLVGLPASPVQAQPAPAQPDCLEVDIESTTWPTGPDQGGFMLTITLTNTCDHPIPGWELLLGLAPGQTASQGWNANWSLDTEPLRATNPGWWPLLHPGASISVGLIGTFTGGYLDPVSCSINGSPCDGAPEPNQPPEVSVTSPAQGDLVILPSVVTFAADASDPDGQVDRVEFYLDGELVGSDDTAPYQVDVTVNSFCDCTALARAFDDGDPALSTDSDPVTFSWITVPPVEVIAEPDQLELAPGGAGVVTVRLGVDTTVDITMLVDGDPGITVAPESFTIDQDTWDTGVEVTVSADPAAAGSTADVVATTFGGSDSVSVTVTD